MEEDEELYRLMNPDDPWYMGSLDEDEDEDEEEEENDTPGY
ncbi:MAG: hypothetical protein H6Q14_768 [Bacteroidetes bacterium]|nr:hypothetical protein [Bacteroidota bacterium]